MILEINDSGFGDEKYVRIEFADRSGIDYYENHVMIFPPEWQKKDENWEWISPQRCIKRER